MRQVVLDTETTGLEIAQGHRVIEIGCVELVNRRGTGRHFHRYLNPDRDIEAGAAAVHGISLEFLRDKPRFIDVVEELLEFIAGAELIIHNAAFDVAFLEHELDRCHAHERFCTRADALVRRIAGHCRVLDSLALAREMHPGQRNSLDALCKRYGVDNSHRELHGALLDARILADVYLAMTGGQSALALDESGDRGAAREQREQRVVPIRPAVPLQVLQATVAELEAHATLLATIDKASGGRCIWNAVRASSAH